MRWGARFPPAAFSHPLKRSLLTSCHPTARLDEATDLGTGEGGRPFPTHMLCTSWSNHYPASPSLRATFCTVLCCTVRLPAALCLVQTTLLPRAARHLPQPKWAVPHCRALGPTPWRWKPTAVCALAREPWGGAGSVPSWVRCRRWTGTTGRSSSQRGRASLPRGQGSLSEQVLRHDFPVCRLGPLFGNWQGDPLSVC
jgi:hypothetical protein